VRSLFFILFAAVREVFPEVKLKMMHGISRGYYCELAGLESQLTDSDIFAIKSEMQALVERDIPFEKIGLPTEVAVEVCNKLNLRYKAKLFDQQKALFTYMYFMDGLANYFYGHMVPSTGYLKKFDLVSYYDGMLLRIPNPLNFSEIQPYSKLDKLFGVFQQHKDWAELMSVPNVACLNEFTINGESGEIIKISEALHEKKIA
jgi:uridine kinase